MQLFLDTANYDDIRQWSAKGLVDGVTTNPSLLAREGLDPLVVLRRILQIVSGPVSAQVTEISAPKMVAQAHRLRELGENIVVKLPCTEEGLAAAQQLSSDGVKLNITLGFDSPQVVPFARLNVTYFSLVLGRIEDFGGASTGRVNEMAGILHALGSSTKLLVASLRTSTQLTQALLCGADAVTVPPTTWSNILRNSHTLQGERDFLANWSGIPDAVRVAYEQGPVGGQ